MKPLTKYVLLQIPGHVLLALVLIWLWPRTHWSPWIAVAGYLLWVLKDFLIYPFVKIGYESNPPTTSAHLLIGKEAVALEDLHPEGYVRVAGELWKAEARGAGTIPKGTRVRVIDVLGLTLVVTTLEQKSHFVRLRRKDLRPE